MEMTEETLRKASCLNDQINDLQEKKTFYRPRKSAVVIRRI